MFDGNPDAQAVVFRTSVPEDLVKAVDALKAQGIPHSVKHPSAPNWLELNFGAYEVMVDSWNEDEALLAVQGISSEFKLQVQGLAVNSKNERTGGRTMVLGVTVAGIAILGVILWRLLT